MSTVGPLPLDIGDELPAVVLEVTPPLVRAFSAIAQDGNASHYDDDAARAHGFQAAQAHGAIAASLALRVLVRNGLRAFRSGDDVELVFVAPVRVGETLTGRARLIAMADGMTFDVWCENGRGDKVIAGTARMTATP